MSSERDVSQGGPAAAADPDWFTGADGRPVPAGRSGRGAAWRGPGWRVFDASRCNGKAARDWISAVVSRYDCAADPADAALLISEMFANAVQHGPAGGRVLAGYCLWRDGARIFVCDAGGLTTPWLRDPGVTEEGGRGLHVVDMIAAAWGHFRAGHAQVVWCDLGKPLDSAAPGDTWSWLPPVLAAVALAPGSEWRREIRLGASTAAAPPAEPSPLG